MSGSKLGWTVFRTVCTVAAVGVTKKVVESGWRYVTGNLPPTDPEDPEVTVKEALAWSIASGVGIGVAQLLASRKAASVWRSWTGDHPPGLGRS